MGVGCVGLKRRASSRRHMHAHRGSSGTLVTAPSSIANGKLTEPTTNAAGMKRNCQPFLLNVEVPKTVGTVVDWRTSRIKYRDGATLQVPRQSASSEPSGLTGADRVVPRQRGNVFMATWELFSFQVYTRGPGFFSANLRATGAPGASAGVQRPGRAELWGLPRSRGRHEAGSPLAAPWASGLRGLGGWGVRALLVGRSCRSPESGCGKELDPAKAHSTVIDKWIRLVPTDL